MSYPNTLRTNGSGETDADRKCVLRQRAKKIFVRPILTEYFLNAEARRTV